MNEKIEQILNSSEHLTQQEIELINNFIDAQKQSDMYFFIFMAFVVIGYFAMMITLALKG